MNLEDLLRNRPSGVRSLFSSGLLGPAGNIAAMSPTTGIGYQLGSAINNATGGAISPLVNSVLGSRSPGAAQASTPAQNMSVDTRIPMSSETDRNAQIYRPPVSSNDRDNNPGEGYFYDAADGWKAIDGGGGVDYSSLSRERDNQISRLQAAFESAQNYANDARNTLSRRRGEFQTDYENTGADIFDRTSSNVGALAGTAKGQEARTTRQALSQGVGGSALQAMLNRGRNALNQSVGDVYNTRASNDRSNQSNLNSRMNWADTEESNVNRYLSDARMQRDLGEQTTLDNFQNTLGSLIDNANARAQTLAAARGQIGNQVFEPNSVTGFGSQFVDGLNQSLAGTQTTPTVQAGQQTGNFNLEGLSALEAERRRRGQLA